MERLIIERLETNEFIVRHGDRWADRLTADEALFLAARFVILPENEVHQWLKTAEQHAAYERQRAAMRERNAAEVANG